MFLGRDFQPEEGEVGKERVVILSHRFWRNNFGADRELIGKPIRMNGEPYTVIGVAAPGLNDRFQASCGFRWPSDRSRSITRLISSWRWDA